MADDIVKGAFKYLRAQPEILATLGAFPDGKPYLFERNLWLNLEGTQSTAARIFHAGAGWTTPNLHNTMRFPRLGLEIFADPPRDPGGNVIDTAEPELRLTTAWKVFDSFLHRPRNDTRYWGELRTIGCTRLAEPAILPVPDGGGLAVLQVFYGVVEA